MNDGIQQEIVHAPDSIGKTSAISTGAMNVTVHISAWSGRKKDKKASAQVTADNNAEAGAASVNKKLLGSCAELIAVNKFVGNARNASYGMTLPWNDSGMRMLTTHEFMNGKYVATMDGLRTEFFDLVNVFLDAYDWEVAQAQARLGGLFDRSDYPTREQLERKFEFTIDYSPIPESGDWRVDVGNEQIKQLSEHYETNHDRYFKNAMDDVWKRTYKMLTHMADRLDVDNNKLDKHGDPKLKTFHDSMVENANEVVELLHACNIQNDPTMHRMARSLSDALHGVTPDQLRNNLSLREDTKAKVEAAIAALPSLDF